MPAAAVIPAPVAYIKVVAVEKLVVGLWRWGGRRGLAESHFGVVRVFLRRPFLPPSAEWFCSFTGAGLADRLL